MSETSRRDVLRAGLTGAAALMVPSVLAQTAPSTPPPVPEEEMKDIESQLAKPLSPEARKLMPGAMQSINDDTKARQKFALPENSEPCTIYVPTGVAERR